MLFENTQKSVEKILSSLKGPVALAFSHQAEDVIALDIALKSGYKDLEVFTLNTGKLFDETLNYNGAVEKFFGISIKEYFPCSKKVAELEIKLGEWGMRESLDNRHLCCNIRKMEPLNTALKDKNAWITGIRVAQSITRSDTKLLEWDEKFKMIKINPLSLWSDEDVFAYIKKYNLPLNSLYSQGFKSIGCKPCTRAVGANEDIRAGRWWWENPEHKECGLHLKP
ncbi:MAG: phosphoadenylyl-sulfate reductase [Campylobacteraceae bacterium]